MSIVACGPFAGMDTDVLAPMLAQAQMALIELQMGKAVASLSYTQGDGSKSLSRRVTTVAECTALIAQLQQALGMRVQARRPLRFVRL